MDKSRAAEPIAGWKVWRQHLARRNRPLAPPFLSGNQPPLVWGWPAAWQRERVRQALREPASLAELVLEQSAAVAPDLPLALQIVALACAMPKLAGDLPPEAWWRLVERLHELATDAQQQRVDWTTTPSDVVRQQLLAGELPLALGYLFPEVRALRGLRKTARAALSEAIIEVTDGQGLPHGRLLGVLGPLFACWTRARWLGERLNRGPWSRDAELQYQWLVRQALRLADQDGHFVLSPRDEESAGWTNAMLAMALELVGDKGDCAAAATAISRRLVPMRHRYTSRDLPDPSLNSDWSGVAVLASGWAPTDVRLAVAYTDEPVKIELSADGQRLLAGAWIGETTCDGEPVRVVGEWERLCWETDKRFDYLEISAELSHGLRLDRQLLLGRADRVLYLTDIIVSVDGTPRRLQHKLQLPLDADAAWQPERETRDGLILRGKARAAVLPLALSEWRADPRSGDLGEQAGSLTLTQEAHGRALCCPLLVDLDRKRTRKERTWRQLTVGEFLEVLPRDAAVAFRAQSGRDQWLFYRSLGPVGNRTFLGQNTAGEFSAGPFLESGEYKEWIEVEAV